MTAFYVLQIISVARKDMVVAIAVATFTATGGHVSRNAPEGNKTSGL